MRLNLLCFPTALCLLGPQMSFKVSCVLLLLHHKWPPPPLSSSPALFFSVLLFLMCPHIPFPPVLSKETHRSSVFFLKCVRVWRFDGWVKNMSLCTQTLPSLIFLTTCCILFSLICNSVSKLKMHLFYTAVNLLLSRFRHLQLLCTAARACMSGCKHGPLATIFFPSRAGRSRAHLRANDDGTFDSDVSKNTVSLLFSPTAKKKMAG